MPNSEQIREILMQVSVFGLVAAAWLGVTLLWVMRQSRRRRQIHDRLHAGAQTDGGEKVLRLWHDGESAQTVVPGERGRSIWQTLEQLRLDAGWKSPLPALIAQMAGVVVLVAVLVLLVTGNVLLGGAAIVVVVIVLRAMVLRSIMKRTILFEKELMDALELGARSLRAGHPLSGAFKLVAEEIEPPVGTVFAEIVEQEALGVGLQQALEQAAQRSRSPDLKLFAASVLIQLRSGGNLADMMDRVNWVIRDRMRLNRRTRVLTAEAQLSKWVLLGLPIALFVLLNILNRSYMEPFFTTAAGAILLAGGCVSLAIGAWVMSRMAVLKY